LTEITCGCEKQTKLPPGFENYHSGLSLLYYRFTNISFTSVTLMRVPETWPMT